MDNWHLIEADFQREYRIDLSEPGIEKRLSERRFFNFVYGLSPNSIFLLTLAQKQKNSPHKPEDLTREQIIARFRK